MPQPERSLPELTDRLTTPDAIHFPSDWKLSRSWQRAQRENAIVGPIDELRFRIVLGSGDPHEVLFAIVEGELRAECGCRGWMNRGWCAHIAYLWLRWTRYNLCVRDADTDRTHRHPPAWLRVSDAEA